MKRITTLVFLCLALAGGARAQTFFSNFGPGDTFNTGNGWGINAPQAIAASFTPTISGDANRIDLALRHVQGVNDYRLDIFADAGGTPMNLPLLSLALTGVAPQTPVPFTVSLPVPLALTAGTTYWVGLFNNAPTADGAWHWNTIGQTGLVFTGTPVAPSWIPFNGATPTFRVYSAGISSAAPEPATVALLALALPAVCGGMRCARHKARPC